MEEQIEKLFPDLEEFRATDTRCRKKAGRFRATELLTAAIPVAQGPSINSGNK